jgi:uncharacterized lipoprotein YmbA
MRYCFVFLPLLLLAGCLGSSPDRFLVETTASTEKVRTDARTISITKISLPTYATEAGIFVQNQAGAIVAISKADWADDTERAMRLFLVRNLAEISGAEVASDPWPLGGIPEAEIRIDVEQMLVDSSGVMRLSGQFSIRRDVASSRNRIRQFNIAISAKSSDPSNVVEAHGRAWQELAGTIARAM